MTKPRRNIEIKCRCADLSAAQARAVGLGARDMGVLYQRDTFFQAPHGRLKIRTLGDGGGHLISYRRPDTAEARASDYHLVPVDQPTQLADALSYALGTTGAVEMRRRLFVYRHTRIHLDEVEGLGTFVELETVIAAQPDSDARAELDHVVAALELKAEDRVAAPYVDLLTPK